PYIGIVGCIGIGHEDALVVHVAKRDHIAGERRAAGGIEIEAAERRGAVAQDGMEPVHIGMSYGIGVIPVGIEIGLRIHGGLAVIEQGFVEQVGILVSRERL